MTVELKEAHEERRNWASIASKRKADNAALRALVKELTEALTDNMGDKPDMLLGGDGMISCRHCGREYDANYAPRDATECGDDCPGCIARAALAKAREIAP